MISSSVTGVETVLARFDAKSSSVREQLRRDMQGLLFKVQAQVVTGKLSGDPLHRRTGNLASGINTRVTETPDAITGTVGTKVVYGRVHEYGGTFQVPQHQREVTTVFGRAVAAHEVTVRPHPATYPERSFLRSTLADMADDIRDTIGTSAVEAVKET
jgi:phage gpG-like protein